MLDIKKVYVIVFKADETNHITGDNPRSAPFLAANAMIDDTEGETSLCYWSIGDERGHSLEGKVVQDLKNGIVFHADNIGETLTLLAKMCFSNSYCFFPVYFFYFSLPCAKIVFLKGSCQTFV